MNITEKCQVFQSINCIHTARPQHPSPTLSQLLGCFTAQSPRAESFLSAGPGLTGPGRAGSFSLLALTVGVAVEAGGVDSL